MLSRGPEFKLKRILMLLHISVHSICVERESERETLLFDC